MFFVVVVVVFDTSLSSSWWVKSVSGDNGLVPVVAFSCSDKACSFDMKREHGVWRVEWSQDNSSVEAHQRRSHINARENFNISAIAIFQKLPKKNEGKQSQIPYSQSPSYSANSQITAISDVYNSRACSNNNRSSTIGELRK